MTTDDDKALVRSYYDEVLAGRDQALLELLLGPTFVSHDASGATVGRDQYVAAVAMTHAAFGDLAVTVHDQVAEGDRVVTRWSATGTHGGDFAGVPATGRRVTVAGIHVHRLQDRRFAEHWQVLDLFGLLRQLQGD